jgi:hypothetical protein
MQFDRRVSDRRKQGGQTVSVLEVSFDLRSVAIEQNFHEAVVA